MILQLQTLYWDMHLIYWNQEKDDTVSFTATINILNMHSCDICIIEVTLRDVSNSKIVPLEHRYL